MLAGGDDVAFNATMAPMLMARPGESMRYFVRHLAEDLPPRRRAGPGRCGRWPIPGGTGRSLSQHCEVGVPPGGPPRPGRRRCARRSAHAYERWDGKGYPDGLAGDEVPIAVRVVTVARDAELWARQAGWPAAAEVLRPPARPRLRPRGGRRADRRTASGGSAERRRRPVRGGARRRAGTGADDRRRTGSTPRSAAVADFTDLKSPWLRGHSTGVAASGGRRRGRCRAARRRRRHAAVGAALVHDVGRVGVPSGIWDRPGPLSAEQWERVRLHPYLTERVLRRCTLLAPFAELAARHHERADGSGYHRGVAGDQLDAGRTAAGRRRRLPRHDRGPAPPARRSRRRRRPPQLLDEVDAGRFGRRRGRRRARRRRPADAGRPRSPARRASPSARSTCCG